MDLGYLQTGFVPVLRALLLFRMPSLSFCQFLLILGKIAGIANCLTGGKDDHRFETQVNANHFIDHWQGLDIVLYQDRNEVAVRTILGDGDRAGFGVLGKVPMPVDIQGSIHLCQGQRGSIPLESSSSVGSRLSILLFLEGGVLGTPLKKVLESSLQVPQGLLNRDRRDLSKPRILLLQVRQHRSKVVVGEPLLMLSIGNRSGMESPIVDEAASSERLSKDDSLFIGRIEPELICTLRLAHCLVAFLLYFDLLFQSRQNLSTQRSIVPLSYLFHLFQNVNRKADRERFGFFLIVFHASILQPSWMHVKWPGPLCPSPKKGTPLLSLCLKAGVLRGGGDNKSILDSIPGNGRKS